MKCNARFWLVIYINKNILKIIKLKVCAGLDIDINVICYKNKYELSNHLNYSLYDFTKKDIEQYDKVRRNI